MTVYALIWELAKHALRGRGRDPVYLLAGGSDSVDYLAQEFDWADDDDDRFCVISAVTE